MLLHLTTDKANVEIADIDLVDGFIPSISKLVNEETNIKDECRLEPAIWFKVMVIEELSIDCKSRVIGWNCIGTDDPNSSDSSITDPTTPPTTDVSLLALPLTPPPTPPPTRDYKHSISAEEINFVGLEHNAFGSDLNDVFGAVPNLVDRYHRNKINTLEFHSEIKRLLHLYVLPCVPLTVANIDAVRKCLDVQQSHIRAFDDKIIEQTERREEFQQYKREARHTFIDELTAPRPQFKCTMALANILSNDIRKDIVESSAKLDEAQKLVDQVKKRLREMDMTDESYAATFESCAALRARREVVVKQHERCLVAQDALGDVIDLLKDENSTTMKRLKSRLRRDSDEDPTQAYYVSHHDEEMRFRAAIIELSDRKKLANKVKEAVRQTLKDLENGRDTCGVDLSATATHSAAGVVGGIVSRSWQTLKQQVDSIFISEKMNSIKNGHLAMCMKVKARCNTVAYENMLFDQGLPVMIRAKSLLSYSNRTLTSSNLSLNSSRSNGLQGSTSPRIGSLTPRSISNPSQSALNLSDQIEINRIRYRMSSSDVESDYGDMRRHDEYLRAQIKKKNDAEKERELVCREPCEPYCYNQMCLCVRHDLHGLYEIRNSRFVLTNAGLTYNAPNRAEAGAETNNTRKHRREAYALSESPVAKCANVMHESFSTVSPTDDAVVVFDSNKKYLKNAIDTLRQEIITHFEETCCALQSELKQPKTQDVKIKIWNAYEPHFYHSSIKSLSDVYFAKYGRKAMNLCHLVDGLTVTDMLMDKATISRILQDIERPRAQSANVNIPAQSVAGKGKAILGAETIDEMDEGNIEEDITDVAGGSTIDLHRSHSNDTTDSSCNEVVKSMILKPRYLTKFAPACECLAGMINAKTLYAKSQHVLRCVHLIAEQIAEFQAEIGNTRFQGACSDDLIDVFVILLCNFDDVPNLYAHVRLFEDLRPSFLGDGETNYSFTHIRGAFYFLFDRLKTKRARIEKENVKEADDI